MNESAQEYWTRHNVTSHQEFLSAEESANYFDWRNKSYLFYHELMPTSGCDDLVILDYGCGPGNDLVGFSINSKPKKVFAADVSATSLLQAERRMNLHGIKNCEFIDLSKTQNNTIPLDNGSVDLIHSSGVLHHLDNPKAVLQEFERILKPGGKVQIMVYNYNSIWLHLYVAYILMLCPTPTTDISFVKRILRRLGFASSNKKSQVSPSTNILEAFRKSTDGIDCPISICYKKEDFLSILDDAGFVGSYVGSSISQFEMSILDKRFAALGDIKLPKEHRDFLYNLKFNEYGAPLSDGFVAGIGGCYTAHKK